MSERLYGEFTSSLNVDYRVSIFDTDFVGTATAVALKDGFSLDIDAPSRIFSESLAAGTLAFTFIITDVSETIKDDIVTSSDSRFSVKVTREGDLYWLGALVSDIGEIKDEGPEYEMNFRAVCGLGLLEEYEYLDESPTTDKWTNTFTGFDRLINIIAICLKKLPHVLEHLTGSTDFIRTGINWYHSGSPYDTPSNINDPLYNCYVLNSNFSGIQTSGNANPLSCAEVIEAILTAFNARIMQVGGVWIIEQYETRTNLIDNRVRQYAYTIAAPILSAFDSATNILVDSGSDNVRLTGGTFGYVKAAKQTIITLDAKTRYNLTEAMRFDETSASDYNAGNVFWDGAASTFRAKGTIAGTFNNVNIPPIVFTVNATLVFRLKVNLSSNYLNQTISYSGSVFQGVVTTMVWSGSTQYVEIAIDIDNLPAIGDSVDFSQDFDFTISTPTGTQGNLSVFFELNRVVNRVTAATISSALYTTTWDMTDPYFAIYYDEDQPIGKQTFQVVNSDYTNQGVVKVNTLIGDAIGLNDRGAIRYLSGADYIATLDWSVRDDVDGFFISDLLGRRILQAQSTPRRSINTTVYGPDVYQFDTPIEYDSIQYFFMGGTFYAKPDHLRGRWLELRYEDISMTTAVNGDTNNSGSPGTSGGTVNQNTGGAGSSGGADGNGIYTGSGTVPDGTTATLDGTLTIQRSSAASGDGFFVVVDDGSNTNELRVAEGSGVRIVSTNETISLEGETAFADVISAATINSSQNDYAGGAGANTLRLTASTAVDITGLAGGSAGRVILIHNIGSNNITLKNADTGSSAANRFAIGEDFALRADHCAVVQYDSTTSRWRIAAADRLGFWAEAYTTSTATTASIATTSAATNINAAIVPKGSGAFILAIPEGSSTGGNARGTKSVDLQIDRISASQVASGTSSGIFAGRRNVASGTYSTVLGGSGNQATAEGACSVGGQLNTVSALYAANVCGNGNTASGNSSATLGGGTNTASLDYSVTVGGLGASAYLHAQLAHASGFFTEVGDAQSSEIIFRRRITGTAQAELFLDGSSIQAILAATNRIWGFRANVVGVCDTAGNGVGITAGEVWSTWHDGAIKRIGTATSIVGAVSVSGVSDTGMATATVTIDADDTTEALRIQITPPTTAGTTTVCRWVATIYLTEIGY